MEFNKKAISPVVATALLLVVAVVAVVGFQTWFNTYQSGLNSKIEQQSNTGSAITIERFELVGSDGNVYLKNSGPTDISNATVTISPKVGAAWSGSFNFMNITAGQIANYTLTITGTTPTIGEIAKILVVTDNGVFSAEKIVR